MSSARRLYIYLVSAISLQAVAWAIIALLRNLIIFGIDRGAVAFQVAVIIIGLPVFLVHWMMGQRSIEGKPQEQGATLRRLYLYGNMAAFLGPFVANLFDLFRRFFREINELQSYEYERLSTGDAVLYHFMAMIVVGILWFYHYRVASDDTKVVPDEGGAATVRRFYVYGFATAGLYMMALAIIHLIRWVMLQFGSTIQSSYLDVTLINEIDRLIIGVPIWIIFWRWAQNLYEGSKTEERDSALRKFYLYGIIFVSAMNVVIHCSLILYELISGVLGVNESSSGDLRQPIPILIGAGILWWYHAFVIREDSKSDETTQQAGVRRLYAYLIAAIGLSALLVGLGAIFDVLINSIGGGFGSRLKDELSWAIAVVITGLPTWFIPWRQMQNLSADSGPSGVDARNSTARKIYLYFFLFIATMTVLSSAVYILYRIIDMFLGGKAPTIIDLAEAISYIIIAVGVWLYHGSILRTDRSLAQDTKLQKIQELKVTVVDEKGGQFGLSLAEAINKANPELEITPVWLSAEQSEEDDVLSEIRQSGLIIGSWEIAVPGGLNGHVTPKIAQMIATSSAKKLLAPTQREGWDWTGVEQKSMETLANQTTKALQQILEGEPVKIRRSSSVGTIIGIVIAVIVVLVLLSNVIWYFI